MITGFIHFSFTVSDLEQAESVFAEMLQMKKVGGGSMTSGILGT